MNHGGRFTRAAWILCASFASGCSLFHDPAIDDDAFSVRESPLGVEELAARIAEADALWAEPRSADRVERALELCLDSVSPLDGHAALWRASRACYWLAGHHPDEAKRAEYGLLGVRLGREAGAREPGDPAGHYYHALNLGVLSRIEGRGVRRVPLMAELARKVIALDERYADAGGRRFLGILCFRTMDTPLVAFGDLDDALEHLRRACELSPGYGGNQLALAEVLIEDGDDDQARERLQAVVASAPPEGEAEDHAEWVERARALLADLGTDAPGEAGR